jgi:hypothetical protein
LSLGSLSERDFSLAPVYGWFTEGFDTITGRVTALPHPPSRRRDFGQEACVQPIGRRAATSYRRFATAAEAVRFAVEEFPAVRTLGAWMQVGDQRCDSDEICRLYESAGYPLRRTLG